MVKCVKLAPIFCRPFKLLKNIDLIDQFSNWKNTFPSNSHLREQSSKVEECVTLEVHALAYFANTYA